MGKSLYSMILNDEVVAEIDKAALRTGTNRSALVNSVLADYVQYMTPEKRIGNIFDCIEQLLADDSELIPFVAPNRRTMSMKSSLEYKYRPTVRYEVQLFHPHDNVIGELSVTFRTQSVTLLESMGRFFTLFKRLEDTYAAPLYPAGALTHALYDGKFVRSIALPLGRDYNNEQLSRAISDYVRMFDSLMKGWINGSYSPHTLESAYLAKVNNLTSLI